MIEETFYRLHFNQRIEDGKWRIDGTVVNRQIFTEIICEEVFNTKEDAVEFARLNYKNS
jgi:hypothetical protein